MSRPRIAVAAAARKVRTDGSSGCGGRSRRPNLGSQEPSDCSTALRYQLTTPRGRAADRGAIRGRGPRPRMDEDLTPRRRQEEPEGALVARRATRNGPRTGPAPRASLEVGTGAHPNIPQPSGGARPRDGLDVPEGAMSNRMTTPAGVLGSPAGVGSTSACRGTGGPRLWPGEPYGRWPDWNLNETMPWRIPPEHVQGTREPPA